MAKESREEVREGRRDKPTMAELKHTLRLAAADVGQLLAEVEYAPERKPTNDPATFPKRWKRHGDGPCCWKARRASRKRKTHKVTPKERKALRRRRLSRMSDAVRTRSAVAPQLFHLLRRFFASQEPGNEFEARAFAGLTEFSKEHLASLQEGLAAFDSIEQPWRTNLFVPAFSGWSDRQPVLPDLLLWSMHDEAARFARMRGLAELVHAGKVRPWTLEVATGDSFDSIIAPWPWINEVNGLRTATHRLKIVGTYLPQELQQTVEWIVNPATGEPSPSPSSKQARPPACAINAHVDSLGNCLRPAEARLGERVTLTGFNYFGLSAKVELTPMFGGNPVVVDGFVIPDDSQPVFDSNAKVIADHRVRDQILFDVPERTEDQLYEFPVGNYQLQVIVPNDIAYTTPDGVQPSEFRSNVAYLAVLPKGSERYRVWSDLAHCFDPTNGESGSDEICLQAYRCTFDSTNGAPLVEGLPEFRWNDVEDGDSAPPYVWNLVGSAGSPVAVPGGFAIGLIGWEVDSEDALDESIRGFGTAFAKFWSLVGAWLGGIGGGGIVGLAIAAILGKLAWWVVIVIAAVVIAITTIVGLIWAAWAPPDQIAFDLIVYSESDLYYLTKQTAPLPADRVYELADGFRTTLLSLRKLGYLYTEERQYVCQEEGSLYGFQFEYQRDI